MNEIIVSLITWCVSNKYALTIDIYSSCGGFYVVLTLKRGKYNFKHYFYVAGGVLNIDNWRLSRCDLELESFLEEAKYQFKEFEEA